MTGRDTWPRWPAAASYRSMMDVLLSQCPPGLFDVRLARCAAEEVAG